MRELNVFGKVEFIRSNRARRITVKILSDGLRVSLPYRSSETEATRFILNNQNVILSKQARIRTKRINTLVTIEKEISTRTFTIKAKYTNRSDVFFSLKEGVLWIEVPEEANINSPQVQNACWNGINYFLKKEAKRILPNQVKALADQYGFKYSSVKIQSSKTRWGSCSKTQNINLSFYLMLLPSHLADYVILHELCHTREMNHGERFWKLMDEVTGGKTKKLRAEMKRFSMP
ncbi:MAG: SprT family zinc-dependent metalloprotease [Paludibacter sp.]|nr:SprT family zinc-dependent metalloprotease [Paludibacter sp.]MDD4198515.1 SprT family zinc-dependent metalloprotease [Paludibacter sp.]MDD4428003.1 SprT family zinc-dependent metalloprotease [Paludibacter sp.]